MKNFLIIFFLFCSGNAWAKKIVIFACEPEWGALAREIVGDEAEVVVATRAAENPFLKIEKNTARLGMMMKADMVFCSGGGLEDQWLPDLLRVTSSPEIKSGKAILMASDYIDALPSMINKKRRIERVHLNPRNMAKIAKIFLAMVSDVDATYNSGLSSSNIGIYNSNYESFSRKLEKLIPIWEEKAKNLKVVNVVVRNDAWAYLTSWLGMRVVLRIENEDGSEKNINDLIAALQKTPAQMILLADFERKKIVYELSNKTKTRVVFLPFTPGGVVGTADIFSFYNSTINRLITDCSKTVCMDIGNSRSVADYFRPDQTITRQSY